MATLPNPHTWTAGDDATSSNLQTLTDALNFFKDPPRARGYQGVAQTLTTGVAAAATFTSEDVDNDAIHSTSTNTSRMTIVTAGRYRCVAGVTFVANATGYRQVQLWRNGSTMATSRHPAVSTASTTHFEQCVEEILCSVGDYIECAAAQNSGGNLDTVTGSNSTYLNVVWAGVS